LILLSQISKILYKKIGLKTWLASLIIFLLFMIFVLPQVAAYTKNITGTGESPDGSYWYSASELYHLADEYGEEGRNYYVVSRFTFDIVWPLVYLFFLSSSLTVLFRKVNRYPLFQYLHLLPFGGVVFDFLENMSASIVMWRYPEKTPIIAELTPIFTFVKWNFIYVSFACLLVGAILFTLQIIRNSGSNK
jgi:hypothetical protein